MKHKFFLVLMSFILIITVPLRLYQFWVNIDEATGFFIVRDWTVWALIGLVVGGGLLLWLLIFYDKTYKKNALSTEMRGLGLVAFLCGGVIAYPGVLTFYAVFTGLRLSFFSLLIELFGVFSGLAVLLLGVDFILKNRASKWAGHLLLVVPLWCLMRALSFFLATQNIRTVSQSLLYFGFLLGATLFSLMHARAIAHTGTLTGLKPTIAWGSSGIILGVTALLPQYLFGVIMGGDPLAFIKTVTLTDIALVAYMIAFTSTLLIHTAEGKR